MRSLTIAVLLATALLAGASSPLDYVDDLLASPSSHESKSIVQPPVKLDKNLRRALLKALVDLEAESAEQHQNDENTTNQPVKDEKSNNENNDEDIDENRYDFLEISKQKSTSFTFDGFPNDEDTPSEDKLQNTTFVENDKFVNGDEGNNNNRQSLSKQQQPPKDYTKGVQVHDVVSSEKASAIYETKQPGELLETVESRSSVSTTSSSSAVANPTSSSNNINSNEQPLIQQSVTFTPIVETLSLSASNNVASAAANSLVAPRPTAATNAINSTTGNFGSKIVQQVQGTAKSNNLNKEEAEEVKIFQAPLVAAFTVQQDERGVPKNIVPLYKNANNVQPLSLQEQLEFKQRLLEKQLAQLQAQHTQQAQFLLRQRQAYEDQLRLKQQQEYYLQEQRRLKLLQEQEQQQQRLRLQQSRPAFQQPANIVQQQLPLPQQQTQFKPNNLGQQQLNFKPNNVQQQQQTIFKPNNVQQQQQQNVFNNVQQQQQNGFKGNNVQFQPSLSLEVPSSNPAIPFKPIQQQQQQQQQQLRGQSFQQFPVNFQQQQLPSASSPLTRFNRQEAFNAVGNFGFNNFQNDDKSIRQSQFVQQQRNNNNNNNNNNFGSFNPSFRQQQQQRQFTPSFTPARQIQELLYQSGIAGDLQGAGTRNQEDINIVSKVLALNVGAFSDQRTQALLQQQQQQQFSGLKK